MAPELGGLAGKAVKMKQDPVTASPEHTGTGLLGMARRPDGFSQHGAPGCCRCVFGIDKQTNVPKFVQEPYARLYKGCGCLSSTFMF